MLYSYHIRCRERNHFIDAAIVLAVFPSLWISGTIGRENHGKEQAHEAKAGGHWDDAVRTGIIEENTRNVTPVNCFAHRAVEGFPSEPFPFVVFAFLTDGLGEISLDILIYRLDTLEEVYRTTHSVQFTNPLQNVRLILRIRDCSFPVPGHYQVTILADNDLVAQRKTVLFQ